MKKMFALLLALLMMFTTCSALAEPSTAYYVSVMDPVVYVNGEPVLDMTGLNVDLGALVSDVGCFALQALAYVGENFDIQAAGAQAQLDTNGLTFSIDGMENIYSLDLTQFTNGFDVTTFLPQIPAHTVLNMPVETEAVSIDLSLPVRYEGVTAMLAEFVAEDGSISIDKTQGELLINNVLTAMETAADSLDIEGVAEIRAMRIAFEMDGQLTVEGDPAANAGSYAITGTGKVYAEGHEDGVPVELNFSDSAEALNMSLNAAGKYQSMSITMDNAFSSAADGRKGTESVTALTLNDEELVEIVYTAAPVEESKQTDYVLSVNLPSEQTSMSVLLSTGTNGDDLGFGLDVFVDDGIDTAGMHLYYNGVKSVDELGTAINGFVSMGMDAGDESFALDTYLLLQATQTDTAEWAYDSANAIALETLSDTDAAALEAGLMGALGTAVTAITENVPGLAEIMSAMMG